MVTLFSILSVSLLVVSLFFVSAGFEAVHALENVSGIISSDTTWTVSNSPYSLTGNVLVEKGVTLTIESGVTINLKEYYIMINGTLCARGKENQTITFNNGEITFTQHSTGWDTRTKTGSIIENANLVSTFLDVNEGSPKIIRNSISELNVYGSPIILVNKIFDKFSIRANSATISNNTVYCPATCSSDKSTAISYNTFNEGLTVSQYQKISNNTIQNGITISGGCPYITGNDISGGLKATGQNRGTLGPVVVFNNTISGTIEIFLPGSKATITNNTIAGAVNIIGSLAEVSKNTLSQGITVGPANLYTMTASIYENTITGGAIGITIPEAFNSGLSAYGRTDATINNNKIFGCSSTGIKIGSGGASAGKTVPYNTVEIEGNTIMNCGSGIEAPGQEMNNNTIANNRVGVFNAKKVENNLIINNTIGIKSCRDIINNTIVNNNIGIENSPTTLLYNNIYNNTEYNIRITSSTTINATQNWWGTTNKDQISKKIYDYYLDFKLGKVTFEPFLTQPNTQAPTNKTPESPSPSISEFSIWVVLFFVVVGCFLLAFYKNKIHKGSHVCAAY